MREFCTAWVYSTMQTQVWSRSDGDTINTTRSRDLREERVRSASLGRVRKLEVGVGGCTRVVRSSQRGTDSESLRFA